MDESLKVSRPALEEGTVFGQDLVSRLTVNHANDASCLPAMSQSLVEDKSKQ